METEQAKYDKSLNEINQLDKRANELHEKVLNLSVALEKRQSDSRVLNEQTRYLKEQLDRLTAQLNAYSLDLNQKTALVNAAKQAREDEKTNLHKLHAESQQIANKYMELINQLTKNEGEKEENQRNIIDNLSKLTDIKANLSAYIAKRDTMQENIKQDKEKLASLQAEQNDLSAEEKSLNTTVQTLNKSKLDKEKNIAEISSKIQSINESLEEVNSRVYALKSSISNDTNRMNILINLQADFEGYQYAVKRLLQERQKNPVLNNAIKGVVGNIISVDAKYQTAIELALGGSIQNIVTKDEEDAKVLIQYLKDNRSGRATFLPISAVKPRTLSQSDRAYLSAPGCLGIASELIKTDVQYKPVIESLLGATVVCDNTDNAVALAKRSHYAFRIVTLDGDIINPQGSMSGGSKKSNDSSLLGKENEIKNLKQNIQDKSKELENVTAQYNSYIENLQKLKALLEQETIALQSVNSDFYTNNTKLENLRERLSNLENEIFAIQSQLHIAENIVNDLNSKINSIDQVEMDYNATKAKVGEFNETNKNAYEELKQKREEYQEELTTSKVKIASTEEKIKALDKDIETLTFEIQNINKNIEQINVELTSQQRIYNEAIALNKSKEEVDEVEKIKLELQQLNEKLAQFDQFKVSLMAELKELDDKKIILSNDISKINNKIYQEEAKLQKVDIDIENMQERIYEEYEMTYNDCLPFKDQSEEFDIKETLIKINRIKNQITGLGYVNINAIEEYKSEGARYEEMNAQIEDLKKAEEDAVAIIKDLSNEMLTQFNTEFVKIQENFTKVFKELFGGGNAKLELLPSEDPLTAGVEIIAQPPGKVLSNITLLSGGEKTMTAIAILFAILKLKPMPFCFLDEIEAALDDANIDRYANYLKRFSNDTQFIVITHRKPTMEVVDSLYGVTMEEKGVSKIVSVKFEDAVKTIDAI